MFSDEPREVSTEEKITAHLKRCELIRTSMHAELIDRVSKGDIYAISIQIVLKEHQQNCGCWEFLKAYWSLENIPSLEGITAITKPVKAHNAYVCTVFKTLKQEKTFMVVELGSMAEKHIDIFSPR